MKKAIVTGITGQDGAYLAQFLLSKNYFRLAEVDALIGNPAKAEKLLGMDAKNNC